MKLFLLTFLVSAGQFELMRRKAFSAFISNSNIMCNAGTKNYLVPGVAPRSYSKRLRIFLFKLGAEAGILKGAKKSIMFGDHNNSLIRSFS
jgi:hypothetical protein